MPRLTPEERLERAKQAEAKAKERAKAALSEIQKRQRKNDTRRKIILGAALIESAARNPGSAKFIAQTVERLERENDRAAFEGWELPRPPAPPSQGKDQG